MLIVILGANSSVSRRSFVEFIESVLYLRDKAQVLLSECLQKWSALYHLDI
jgi:hypothetical protein